MTNIESSEIDRLRELFNTASGNDTGQKVSSFSTKNVPLNTPEWNNYKDYMTNLSQKYNFNLQTQAINHDGEIVALSDTNNSGN